jgi:hypothetical protein
MNKPFTNTRSLAIACITIQGMLPPPNNNNNNFVNSPTTSHKVVSEANQRGYLQRYNNHARTSQLLPSSIFESEDILLHGKAGCFHEGLDGNAREARQSEVGSDEMGSTIGWDVSVH